MSDARTDVLDRIRAALGGSVTSPVDVPRDYRAAGDQAPGSAAALDLLEDRLVDYKAHVRRVSEAGVGAALAELVAELAAGRPDDAESPGSVVVPDGLDPAWLRALPGIVVDSPAAPRTNAELDEALAVITAARVAIAETGTIVLDGEPDQGRRAISLVPDVHLCVVRAAQVVQTVPEAVRLLAAHPQRPQTWVSGPSATSDIELSRVEGVHGPRTLHVLLVV